MIKHEIGVSFVLLVTIICILFLSTQLIEVTASIAASTSLQPPDANSDVYVSEQSPTTYFNTTTLAVGWSSNYQRWTCLYWDVSSISGTISVADVRITANSVFGAGIQVNIYRITSDWMPYSGDNPTWNTRPSYDATVLDSFTAVDPGIYTDNLITSTAENWRTGAVSNYGIYLIGIGRSGDNAVVIHSLDQPPPVYLDITYAVPEFNGKIHVIIFSLLAAAICTIELVRKRFLKLTKFES